MMAETTKMGKMIVSVNPTVCMSLQSLGNHNDMSEPKNPKRQEVTFLCRGSLHRRPATSFLDWIDSAEVMVANQFK